jgi:peptide deformylase
VRRVDDQVRKLCDDMLETMSRAPGIGLSAVQVGVPERIVTIDVGDEDENGERKPAPLCLINPEIVRYGGKLSLYDEGCLSLPEFFAEIERPEAISVKFLDYHGKAQQLDTDGLAARCIQHELDHLEGILFVDHISVVKRNMILRKLTKVRRQKTAV